MANAPSRNGLRPPTEKTILFQKERDSGITYRIPSLIYIEEDRTFLALAEKRSTQADTDAKILVMRKGKPLNGTVQWSPIQELTSASLPKHRTMNPCTVYEKRSKTLFLFFICIPDKISEQQQIRKRKNAARLCYTSSTDKGESWSKVKDLTDTVIGEQMDRWATFAVGPGHGIQSESGKLIIPAYVYYIQHMYFCSTCKSSVQPQAFYFYSNDNGKTWLVSETVKQESGECEIAEVIDPSHKNNLYCNARNMHGNRVEALGASDRTDFAQVKIVQSLREQTNGCQGSVIGFPASGSESVSGTQTWLLFSHPTNQKARKDLGVYLNKKPLSMSDWGQPWVICPGPSAYSDLAYCEDLQLFACLLECGTKNEYEQIAFINFTLDDVLKAINDKTPGPF